MERTDLPLGFGMALAQNEAAMRAFAQLSEQEQAAVVRRTHDVRSRSEMQNLVSGLATGVLR